VRRAAVLREDRRARKGARHLGRHDLAYADITFDGWKAPSIMQVPGARDVAVEFFTMSKSYNMAGWRIGFMVGNKDLVAALARIKGYHDYGTVHSDPGGSHRRAGRSRRIASRKSR
jgi:histidinol-phosphate/aromatic aminotransferase/cobyric acid decarboxylase-like protein